MFNGKPDQLVAAFAQIVMEECHCTQWWAEVDDTREPRGPVTPAELTEIQGRMLELFITGVPVLTQRRIHAVPQTEVRSDEKPTR